MALFDDNALIIARTICHRAKKSTLARFTQNSYRRICQSCRTCNCAVSWWRSWTVLFNSARSLSAGSGCDDNLFTISRTFSHDVSRRWSRRSVTHRLYAINAGMERSIVVILSWRFLWRPIKLHRRSSISDATFAKGESRVLPLRKRWNASFI